MAASHQVIQPISQASSIRLYNSVTTNDTIDGFSIARQSSQVMQHFSIESIRSTNEFNNSCRICRWNRSDMELTKCPCLCKGSVGFIHLACLKRWIMHRRDNHCEICNGAFNIPEEKFSLRRMMKSFFCRCAGPILRHLLYSVSLMPLTHVILQQVVICMENINVNPNEDLTVKEVALAATALLTSSALFFHIFEFITTRLILVRNILRHWWLFGNSSDFALIEMESEIMDLFT